jgi:hypothetical protein
LRDDDAGGSASGGKTAEIGESLLVSPDSCSGTARTDQADQVNREVFPAGSAGHREVVFSALGGSGISRTRRAEADTARPTFRNRIQADMDHTHQPTGADDLPVQRPRLCPGSADDPADFVPLYLVLQPSGAIIEVDQPSVVVGRHTDADIRLPLPDVSRRHCRLQFVEGCWQVIDLNSLNGIQVNGEQVLQSPLEHGDLLRIGGFTFAISLSGKAGTSGLVESIIKTLSTDQSRRAS